MNSPSYIFLFLALFFLQVPALSSNLASLFRSTLNNKQGTTFKVTNGNLSISSRHYQLNNQSLRWNWLKHSTLQIISPPINPQRILNNNYHTTQIWIYNEKKINQSLKFQYLDTQSVVNYHFKFILNYQGWRRLTRSYLYDMNKIQNSTNNISAIRVTSPANLSGSLYFGEWKFLIPRQKRIASRQMPDVSGLLSSNQYLNADQNTIRIKSRVTRSQIKDLKKIKAQIQSSLRKQPPSKYQLTEAQKYYKSLEIIIADNIIKGKFTSPSDCKSHLYTFARDFFYTKNYSSYWRAVNMIWLINDFGYDYGSELVYQGHDTVDYYNGVLLIYQFLNKTTKQKVYSIIKWSLKMKQFWESDPKLGWDSDYVHNNLRTALGSIVICNKDKSTAVTWLNKLKTYLQAKNRPSLGVQGWIKPDMTLFHHKGHYISYMQSFNSYINILNILHKTRFQINEVSYKQFRDVAYNLFIFSNKFQYANSLCGRYPFSTKIPITKQSYKKLAIIGGHILGNGLDQKIARAYSRVWNDSFFNLTAQSFPEGFWQFNFSPTGVYRKNPWVATIRGFNSILWGTQIYKQQNRFGRYQSYGAVQIMYQEGAKKSGIQADGYNWNLVPGTTTQMLGWADLNISSQIIHQRASSNFSGALRFEAGSDKNPGKYGMYAFDFHQANLTKTHDSAFTFKKSIFCFDDIIICVGSNIHSIDANHPVVTTLFQSSLQNKTSSIVIDGKNISDFPFTSTLNVGSHWFLDSRGNGYFIKSKKTIFVTKSNQTSPTSNNKNLTSGIFATAFMSHGTSPKNSSYQYVIIPQANYSHLSGIVQKLTKPWIKNETTSPQISAKNKNGSSNPISLVYNSSNNTSQQNKQNSNQTKKEQKIGETKQNQTKFSNSLYNILQANENAHIIHYLPEDIYAYSLFANNTDMNNPFILSNNASCMVMLKKVDKVLNITVVDPLFLYRDKTEIKLVLHGNYLETNTNNLNQNRIKSQNNTTLIYFDTQNGNPVDISLIQVTITTNNTSNTANITNTINITNPININNINNTTNTTNTTDVIDKQKKIPVTTSESKSKNKTQKISIEQNVTKETSNSTSSAPVIVKSTIKHEEKFDFLSRNR